MRPSNDIECEECYDNLIVSSFKSTNDLRLCHPFVNKPQNKQKFQDFLATLKIQKDKSGPDTISKYSTLNNEQSKNSNELILTSPSTSEKYLESFTDSNCESSCEVKLDLANMNDHNFASKRPTYRCSIERNPGISKRRIVILNKKFKSLKFSHCLSKSKYKPSQTHEIDSTVSQNTNINENNSVFIHPIQNQIVQKDKNYESSLSEDDDDKLEKRGNRRLELERPCRYDESKTQLQNVTNKIKKKNISQKNSKIKKSSANMWISLLKNTKCCKEENRSNIGTKCFMNFEGMLDDYVWTKNTYLQQNKNKTLYERMYERNLNDPNYELISELYIPPALVEVFHQKFTDDLTSCECLRQICSTRHWPEPTYQKQKLKSGQLNYLYSCTLKGVTFVPATSASNKRLAKELAASYCLHWLGISQRKSDVTFSDYIYETYF